MFGGVWVQVELRHEPAMQVGADRLNKSRPLTDGADGIAGARHQARGHLQLYFLSEQLLKDPVHFMGPDVVCPQGEPD